MKKLYLSARTGINTIKPAPDKPGQLKINAYCRLLLNCPSNLSTSISRDTRPLTPMTYNTAPNPNSAKCQQLLLQLCSHCEQQLPFCSPEASATDSDLLSALQALAAKSRLSAADNFSAQDLVCRLVGHYAHITPYINRDLLWLLGGDCLHYLSDDEILGYQHLDELIFNLISKGEQIDFDQLRAAVFATRDAALRPIQ